MTGSVNSYTKHFKLKKINFNTGPWHDLEWSNLDAIDTLIYTYLNISNVQGIWQNSTAYTQGQRLVDANVGLVYECLIDHTSPATGTFEDARLANPTYWRSAGIVPENKGTWVTGTEYAENDYIQSGHKYAVCLITHTAGASFDADVTAGYWDILVDLTQDVADVDAAVTATLAAKVAAETAETNAETAATAAAADAVSTAADRVAVAADKSTVAADKAIVASDKATVAADKATVAADKAIVAADKDTAVAAASTASSAAIAASGFADDADASATAAAASAASINLPSPIGNGGKYMRQKTTEDGFEYRTAAETRADLSLGTLAQQNASNASNIAIGTPLATWTASVGAFQVGAGGVMYSNSVTTVLGSNYYSDIAGATNKFLNDGYAQAYRQNSDGSHTWQSTAAAGTAGDAATLATVMTLTKAGALSVADNVTLASGKSLVFGDGTQMSTAPVAAAGGSFKNLIIGGDFTTNPWQRGTSSLPVNTYTADRFTTVISGLSAEAVVHKTADAPTIAQAGVGTSHCLHYDVTTADTTVDVGDYAFIEQRIEYMNHAQLGWGAAGGKTVTLQFFVKATKTGTYCVSIQNGGVAGAYVRSYVVEYTVNSANTWEKKTVTVSAALTGGDWGSASFLRVSFVLACGSTYHTTAGAWQTGTKYATSNQVNALDSTSNDFKLALIQLEVGTSATDFEALPADVVFLRCARYAYVISGYYNWAGCGQNTSSTNFKAMIPTPVPMRAWPTLTYSSLQDLVCNSSVGGFISITGLDFYTYSQSGVTVHGYVSSGLVAGDANFIRTKENTSSFILFSAEL